MPKEEKAQLQQTTAPGLMHSPTTTFFESQAWSNSQEAAEQAAAEKAAAEEKVSMLFIKGIGTAQFSVTFNASDTILAVKEKIQEQNGKPPRLQRLVSSSGNLLSNNAATLLSLGIKSGDIVNLILRLPDGGGGRRRKTRRKRKRKTRNKKKRKKKRKRKRKKRKRKTRKRMCKFRK